MGLCLKTGWTEKQLRTENTVGFLEKVSLYLEKQGQAKEREMKQMEAKSKMSHSRRGR